MKTFVAVICVLVSAHAIAAATTEELENAFAKGQWNETAEIAHEMLLRDGDIALPKLRGGYALFQLGYPNSALYFLKHITPEQWKSLPKGQDRFVEIVSLFQKKVPLSALPGRMSQVRLEDASPHLRDEIQFAIGREAFERGDLKAARQGLSMISTNSRFWTEARYLLACVDVMDKKYPAASAEFSRIFQPAILDQSTEFWKDFSTEMTSHWGPSLKVMLDTSLLSKTSKLGELAVLGAARVAYAEKRFDQALAYYDRLSPNSQLYPRATLEKIWTLLALNQHDRAEQVAATLSLAENSPESIEARPLRALILTDASRTNEARTEIDNFLSVYEKSKEALVRFRATLDPNMAPGFLSGDLREDARLEVLRQYTDGLRQELEKMRGEDPRVFPVYRYLEGNLTPLLSESKMHMAQLMEDHINRMLTKLERLYVQAKLIRAETYLEDRELLRKEFKNVAAADQARQQEHDLRLAKLLQSAVDEVDEASAKVKQRHLNLEFRQAELLWELSSARGILSQVLGKKGEAEQALALKRRALQISQDIVANFHDFKNYAGALFFSGYAEMELGQENLGLQTLRNYIQLYPKSDHSPDAYRILADNEFDSNHFLEAEALYQKILEFPNSPIVGYALYKIGWCSYNRKDFSRALLGLEQAVLWADQWDKTTQLITLQREAKRDLISIYAEVGDYKKAPEYFQKFLHGESAPWILDLTKQLDTSGQYEKSAELYRYLITGDPGNIENLGYQTSIVWGEYKLHHWPNVLTEMRQLIDRYGPMLTEPQPEDKSAGRCEKMLREVLLAGHLEFQNSSAKDDVTRLDEIDKLYLSAFNSWSGSEAPLYQHADLLLKRKDYLGAVGAYRTHWNRFQTKLDPKMREESLRNLIHSLEQVEDQQTAGDPVLSATAVEILGLVEEYRNSYPNSKYIRAITYLGSALPFKYQQTDKGIVDSQRVFDFNPRDEFGKKAFQNLRVAYYKKADWETTYQWADGLATRKFPGMELYSDDLRTIRQESLFLWAEGTKDDKSSGDLYMKIASSADMQPLWAKSLYNAFIRYQKAGERIAALRAGKQLEDLFPNYDGLIKISGSRAAMLQEAGSYTAAYPLLIQFIQRQKEAPADALQQARLNAGLIAEATGNYGDAKILFKSYQQTTKEGAAGGSEAARALARIQTKENRGIVSIPPRIEKVMSAEQSFEKTPIAARGELADRIRDGGMRLEALTKELFSITNDQSLPDDYAYEAYCSVPFLYGAYERALNNLAMTTPDSLRTEIQKIALPIGAKAKSLAEECLTKSVQAEHDGAMYRKVNRQWGWQWDPILAERANGFLAMLEKHFPWLEASPSNASEDELIRQNLATPGLESNWYALARVRCGKGQIGLCRLTLVDALGKVAHSGRVTNALAVLEMGTSDGKHLSPLFERAANEGSPSAWANLAVYHLRGARLNAANNALRQALATGAFESDTTLKGKVAEWVK